MAIPYILIEKSVLRKPGSTQTIDDVITEAQTWMETLQTGNSIQDQYYYAEVIDSDTQNRYYVYSQSAKTYFGLTSTTVQVDSAASGGFNQTAAEVIAELPAV